MMGLHAQPATALQAEGGFFGFEQVVALAADLARNPYKDTPKVPEYLTKIDYDHWREIRFKPERALWRDEKLLFEIQLFHVGFLYNRSVEIHIIEPGAIQTVPFSSNFFEYGTNDFRDQIPKNLGYAGFRLHYPINRPDYKDEIIVFLGASYFRALGRGQQYGISARGLAINTGIGSSEEFPYFKEFWLVKPPKGEKTITLFALMDSPSMSAAYEFFMQPAENTRIHVKCTIFQRRKVNKLGIAPLTSMFFYGENINSRPVDDFRPEIHDSDALLIQGDNRNWILRPLFNPELLAISEYAVNQLKGFGVLQRDLEFDHYQDLETFYHKRPSVWITPEGDWGAGRVELIEIPSDQEMHDNINVYWVPRRLPDIETPLTFGYEMNWGHDFGSRHQLAKVVATRRTMVDPEKRKIRLIIDFAREGKWKADPADLKATIEVGPGARLVEDQLQKNRFNNTFRLTFVISLEDRGTLEKLMEQGSKAIDLQAFLQNGEEVISEIWNYRIEK